MVNFASDIGGQLGLWVGFSVLTLAELFELLMLIGYYLAKKFKNRTHAVQPLPGNTRNHENSPQI